MKRLTIALFGIILISVSLGLGNVAGATDGIISPGIRNEEVKAIQEILKEDSAVYPEGYTTGFYGALTEKAVKKLQGKFSLPQTGKIDSETLRLIFPDLRVQVVSPNGGEVWNRNNIQTIRWRVVSPASEAEVKAEKYFRPKASIDLFRKVRLTDACLDNSAEACLPVEKTVFVKHIATVNLFDFAYSWRIPESVRNSNDYVVRISIGRGITPLLLEKSDAELQQAWSLAKNIHWDESDGPFTVTGNSPDPHCPDLEEIIKILEDITQELNKTIRLLKGISVR